MIKEVIIADKLSGGVFGEASLGLAGIVAIFLALCIPALFAFAPFEAAPKLEQYALKNPNTIKGKFAKFYSASIPKKAVDFVAKLPPVKLKNYKIDWVYGAIYFVAGWLIIAIETALLLGLGFLLATKCSSLLKTSPVILFWSPLFFGMTYLILGCFLAAK